MTLNRITNGSASSDPDGDELTFTWTGPFPEGNGTATGPTLTVTLPLGEHTLTLTVDDGNGETATDEVVINVVDETPPVIALQPSIELWPPNHKYHTISLEDIVSSVSDACAGDIEISEAIIASVSSDEPEDAAGNGDGKTTDDILIAEDCKSVQLRAERAGSGSGRVYTINLEVSDANGNVADGAYHVVVPHDQGQGDQALDDGVAYSVSGDCDVSQSQLAVSPQMEAPAVRLPEDYALLQNYPNPFNPETEIRFQLPRADHVVLRIFNTLGQEIRTLVDSPYAAGYHGLRWDSKDDHGNAVSSGVYIYQLRAGDFLQVKKMILLR